MQIFQTLYNSKCFGGKFFPILNIQRQGRSHHTIWSHWFSRFDVYLIQTKYIFRRRGRRRRVIYILPFFCLELLCIFKNIFKYLILFPLFVPTIKKEFFQLAVNFITTFKRTERSFHKRHFPVFFNYHKLTTISIY